MKNADKNKVIQRILELCENKKISIYRLAKDSQIPNTTLHNMIRNDTMPTIPTIEKICKAFGITMAQFFLSEDIYEPLTEEQRVILEMWDALNEYQKELAKAYLMGLCER